MRIFKSLALAGMVAATAAGLGGAAEAAAPAAMHREGATRAPDSGAAQKANYGYRHGYYGQPHWGGHYRPHYRPFYYAPPVYYRPAPYYAPYYYPPYYYAPPVYYYGVP